ncbi:type III-B CRISPR module-associated protein Cmr5 [Hydrogenobaculum acidophilum]
MPNMRKTLEQERASFCLHKVEILKQSSDEKNQEKYALSVKRLPQLIVNNGLIPTLAYYKSKEEKKPVYDNINEWLKKKNYISNDALKELVEADFQKLRAATIEILAISNWLKRIVEAEIKIEKEAEQ